MRMHRLREVARGSAHLDRQHAFGDKFAGAVPDDAHTQQALGLWLNDQLRETVWMIDRQSAAGGAPGELGNFDRDALRFRLRFRETGPRYFGLGENHSR